MVSLTNDSPEARDINKLRRVHFDECVLLRPPVSLRDLPPDAVMGTFMGVAAFRFETAHEAVSIFLHDFEEDDIAKILEWQRRRVESQFVMSYGCREFWWEQP